MSVEQRQLMGSGSISASDCTVSFASLFFSSTKTMTTTTSLRIGVFSVCYSSYCLLLSLSPPSSLLLVVCQPSYRLLLSPAPLSSSTTTRTTTTSLRIGVFSVCQPSYCLLLSLSPPLPSFWSSVRRAIVFFSRLHPFPLRRRQGPPRLH